MSTPPADPKTTPPADGEAGRIASIDEKISAAKDEILAAVRDLVGGARSREREHLTEPGQGKAERAAKTLDEQIADAIRVNDEARARDAAEKAKEEAKEDRLAALEAAGAEKQPVQRTRRHRVMGWGEPPQ